MQYLNEMQDKLVGFLSKLESLEKECLKVWKFKENPGNGIGNEKAQNSTDFFGAKPKPGASPIDVLKNLEVMGNLISGYKAVVKSQPSSTARSETTLNIESLIKPEEAGVGLSNVNAMGG
jgi:hypothetical protein